MVIYFQEFIAFYIVKMLVLLYNGLCKYFHMRGGLCINQKKTLKFVPTHAIS